MSFLLIIKRGKSLHWTSLPKMSMTRIYPMFTKRVDANIFVHSRPDRDNDRSENLVGKSKICSVTALILLPPAIGSCNSAPAVLANVHRLSRSSLKRDSILLSLRIPSSYPRHWGEGLLPPASYPYRIHRSTFPLIASCRCCVHYRFDI